jgi:hypothetical protein
VLISKYRYCHQYDAESATPIRPKWSGLRSRAHGALAPTRLSSVVKLTAPLVRATLPKVGRIFSCGRMMIYRGIYPRQVIYRSCVWGFFRAPLFVECSSESAVHGRSVPSVAGGIAGNKGAIDPIGTEGRILFHHFVDCLCYLIREWGRILLCTPLLGRPLIKRPPIQGLLTCKWQHLLSVMGKIVWRRRNIS